MILPDKKFLVASLALLGLGYIMTLIFSDRNPNDSEIARAYDNGAGVEASQCRRITVFPYEGRGPDQRLVSQAPSLNAHICSFINKQNNQVSSGVLVKSSGGKKWIAISHFASYADATSNPLSTTTSSIPMKMMRSLSIRPPLIEHSTQDAPVPKVIDPVPKSVPAPLQDDGSFQNEGPFSGGDIVQGQESQPTLPAIPAHADAMGNETQKN